MKIVVLGSGSKGNCVYIETKEAKILIDAGLTYSETYHRLLFKKIKLENLDAVFITHEHTDHINGLVNIVKYTNATIYVNKESFLNFKPVMLDALQNAKVAFIKPNTKYRLNDLVVVPITLSHDTKNCYGYLLKSDDATYAHITDTGVIDNQYFKLLSSIDTLLIESNHDEIMLQESSRPYFLKQRILSTKGHLSNKTCVSYLKEIVSEKTKRVILAHLSEECNTEAIALQEVIKEFNEPTFKLLCARQKEPLDVITIGEEDV
jgi:phosphoribosyl 1,2-cyclic phosphodiesterase